MPVPLLREVLLVLPVRLGGRNQSALQKGKDIIFLYIAIIALWNGGILPVQVPKDGSLQSAGGVDHQHPDGGMEILPGKGDALSKLSVGVVAAQGRVGERFQLVLTELAGVLAAVGPIVRRPGQLQHPQQDLPIGTLILIGSGGLPGRCLGGEPLQLTQRLAHTFCILSGAGRMCRASGAGAAACQQCGCTEQGCENALMVHFSSSLKIGVSCS